MNKNLENILKRVSTRRENRKTRGGIPRVTATSQHGGFARSSPAIVLPIGVSIDQIHGTLLLCWSFSMFVEKFWSSRLSFWSFCFFFFFSSFVPIRTNRQSARKIIKTIDKRIWRQSFVVSIAKNEIRIFFDAAKSLSCIPCVSSLWKRNARSFLFFFRFCTLNSGGWCRSLHFVLAKYFVRHETDRISWSCPFRQKRVVGPANTSMHLQRIICRERSGTNDSTNGERKPTALPAMPLHLYSGHWNNLFRFLITEARSGTPRENANAAEALALLDCRFYHMLRTYDTHCHEYTHTSLPHLLSIGSISARPYVVYSLWDYFIKKLKPDRKQINGFCL